MKILCLHPRRVISKKACGNGCRHSMMMIETAKLDVLENPNVLV